MATCKDCVHVDVCCSYLSTAYNKCKLATPDFKLLKNIECDECQHFHDRSRFVELPCKVYTTFIGRVVDAKIYGYEASMKNSNCSWTIEPQHFGKYVFFTQEAAEQTLKERESNAGRNDI